MDPFTEWETSSIKPRFIGSHSDPFIAIHSGAKADRQREQVTWFGSHNFLYQRQKKDFLMVSLKRSEFIPRHFGREGVCVWLLKFCQESSNTREWLVTRLCCSLPWLALTVPPLQQSWSLTVQFCWTLHREGSLGETCQQLLYYRGHSRRLL